MDISKKKLRLFEAFSSNPFFEREQEEVMDMDFVLSLSKVSVKIVRYLIYKEAYTDEKFVFDVKEFNKLSGYKFDHSPVRGFIELCSKNLLGKTAIPFVFWVNKKMLSNGVLAQLNVSYEGDKEKL